MHIFVGLISVCVLCVQCAYMNMYINREVFGSMRLTMNLLGFYCNCNP